MGWLNYLIPKALKILLSTQVPEYESTRALIYPRHCTQVFIDKCNITFVMSAYYSVRVRVWMRATIQSNSARYLVQRHPIVVVDKQVLSFFQKCLQAHIHIHPRVSALVNLAS